MAAAGRLRLSVVLEVGEPATAALARVVDALRDEHPGLRWSDPGTWHVVLAVPGAVSEDGAAAVDDVVAATAGAHGPMRLRLDGRAGTFPGGVFSAVLEDSAELDALAGSLGDGLDAAGLAVAQHMAAHCILARVPRGSRLPPPLLRSFDGPAVSWTARRVTVVRSRLQVGGISHELHSAHRLTGEGVGSVDGGRERRRG
jgi:2'-5' RNA ligase